MIKTLSQMSEKFSVEQVHCQTKVIVMLGGPGSGKTTFVDMFREHDPRAQLMLSVTTRERRATDREGEYLSVSKPVFDTLKAEGAFAWTTGVFGNKYGTLRCSVEKAEQMGGVTVMHMEPGCVPPLINIVPCSKLCLIFLTVPPDELERRLRERDSHKGEDYFQQRLRESADWEKVARCDQRKGEIPYHFVSNGGNLEEAFKAVLNVIST